MLSQAVGCIGAFSRRLDSRCGSALRRIRAPSQEAGRGTSAREGCL